MELEKGVIAAKRHIHMTPESAKEYGLSDKQIVSVKVGGAGRMLTFGDVVVRVRSDFAPACTSIPTNPTPPDCPARLTARSSPEPV